MAKYYCDNYHNILSEIMVKKNWVQAVNQESDIKFSYSNKIQGDLMLSSDDEIKWLEKCVISKNKFTSYVRIYVNIINSTQIFVYKEGKIYRTSNPSFFTRDKYYNSLFHNINIKIYETIKPELEKHPHSSNTFKIVALDFGIDDKSVELISIDTNPDLSKERDIIDKMKLHYWIINDLIYLFVFNNKNGHRWYECIDKKKPTYLINRSSILKNILNKNGWIEGKINETVDFSYWDVVDAKNVRVDSKTSAFPRNITNRIDNKKTMYLELQKSNLTHFLPITYTELESIDSSIFSNNKIFFLKKHNGSGGKDVVAINNFDVFKKLVNNNYKAYILQEEVNNMYLESNHKTCLRIHVLLTEKLEIYIHKEGKVYIYPNKYDKQNLDNATHNSTYNSEYKKFSTMHYYKETFNKIKDITFLCITPFIKNIKLTNSYHILGLDYILDNDFNPFLIEVNTYPNISPGNSIVRDINTSMINDFYELYIKKTKKHNWVLCNPLFEDTHFQFKFKEVYLENLFKNMKDYDYNVHDSRLVSLNYWSKVKFNDRHFRLMNKNFILLSDCKRRFHKFCIDNGLEEFTPKTYNSIEDIEDKSHHFYVKVTGECSQINMIRGDYNYIKSNIDKYVGKSIVIQEKIENTIFFDKHQVTFGVFFGMFYDEFLLDTDISITFDTHHTLNEKLTGNIYQDEHKMHYTDLDIKHDIVKKNILSVCNNFLKKYYNFMKTNYTIGPNEIGYGRFDLIVIENTYKPYIVEINSSGAGNHNLCSLSFFTKFYNYKLNKLLFNLDTECQTDLIQIS